MKNLFKILILAILLFPLSCVDLDLNPLSEGSSENWYSTEDELDMSIAGLLNVRYWNAQFTRTSYSLGDYGNAWTDSFTDDWTCRNILTPITNATINGQTNFVISTWTYAYQCIANANLIIDNINNSKSQLSQEKMNEYEANARFARACQYAKLIFLYGDVPFYTEVIDIDEALTMSRTEKEIVLEQIYEDFDYAIEWLPLSYNQNELTFATKGAAMAMKARTALHMEDFTVARDAALDCINLGIYDLDPNFRDIFLPRTRSSSEFVFCLPRSVELGEQVPPGLVKEPATRTVGLNAYVSPSWELFSTFLCTDGKPIDESPLFNPREPFLNRDPRCTETIVEFQTPWLGFMYQPHPDSLDVLNLSTGQYQKNMDNRANSEWASFNGLVWKKGIDESWIGLNIDPLVIIMRYADVLLMYAEAKIELNEIDNSVLEAMNKVRARAYKVPVTATSSYPSITTTDQAELRKMLRIERRMEFAFEGLRYFDIIRWRLANKVLNLPVYGMLEVADLRSKIVNQGLWFFPSTPLIDEDGVADFTHMYNNGQVRRIISRKFDASKQYLWPIPSSEILVNDNLRQNDGY